MRTLFLTSPRQDTSLLAMANGVISIPRVSFVENNHFSLRNDYRYSNPQKLFTRRELIKEVKNGLDFRLYRQAEVMFLISRLSFLCPYKRDFRLSRLWLLLSVVYTLAWTYFSLSYVKRDIELLMVATARYILTFVRLVFCCLSVLSTLYLHVVHRVSFYSFFNGMERLDSLLHYIGSPPSYPNNRSFVFHVLLTLSLICVQTNFFSRQNFIIEVQNQYRYCVFITIHIFCVLLSSLTLRFRLLASMLKKCDSNSLYRLYTLINVHKNLCHNVRKLRKIYSFQIVMIFAVIIITYIWNIHRFSSIVFRFEDEYAKKKVISIKSRTIMITLYTYWLWLMANTGENLRIFADAFYEELYSVILHDETNILSKDLMLKAYLSTRLSGDYRLCKMIHLDNRIIHSVMGITVSYIIVSIQLSIPCTCKNGVIHNHFI